VPRSRAVGTYAASWPAETPCDTRWSTASAILSFSVAFSMQRARPAVEVPDLMAEALEGRPAMERRPGDDAEIEDLHATSFVEVVFEPACGAG